MDKIKYQEVHRWLRKNYGPANKCSNPSCEGSSKFYDWSLIKGFEYECKIEAFQMLCRKCHLKYDGFGYFTNGHKINNGRKFTTEHKRKISERQKQNNSMKGKFGKLNPFYGKKHSLETKLKLSIAQKKRFSDGSKPCQKAR